MAGSTNLIYFQNGDPTKPLPPRTAIPHPKLPRNTFGRSFVNQTDFNGSWSLAATRTCTDTHGPGHTGYHNILEPHEFAHMLGLGDSYLDARRNINGFLPRTRGDLGSASDDVVIGGVPGVSDIGILGTMQNFQDFHKAYALTVAFVIIRHMNEVWGHKVEDWEILE